MARPPRSSDRPRGGGSGSSRRRPGDGQGTQRRGTPRSSGIPRNTGTSPEPRRTTPRSRTEPERRTPPRASATAHPEAHRLTTRTDTSSTLLGPRTYTPRRIGLLAVISIVLLVTVSFPLRNHYQFRSEQRAVAQEKAALEKTIAELEAEQELLADPAYIEQQARIRFGAVKPGETPYRVSPYDPVEKAEADAARAELEAMPWQSRVWSSIAEPRDPILPEGSRAGLHGTGLLDPTVDDGAEPPQMPDVPGGAPVGPAVEAPGPAEGGHPEAGG